MENREINIEELGGGTYSRITNPNQNRTEYPLVYSGVNVKCEPFRIMRIPSHHASHVVGKAEQDWMGMKTQAEEERRAFIEYSSSSVMKVRDQARKFAKLVGEEIVTVTQPPKYPWLVDIDSEKGKKIFEEAKREAGIKDYEEAKAEKHIDRRLIKMDRPKASWKKDQVIAFLNDNGGTWGPAEPEDKLLAKAQRLFDADVEKTKRLGIDVEVV